MILFWWLLWMFAAGIEFLAGWGREFCDRKIKGEKKSG